jgi:hypothetical protein
MSLRLNTEKAERTAVIDPAQNVAESAADRPFLSSLKSKLAE